MDMRKLISFGKGSYIISMPKKWIEKNKVKSEDIILNRFVNNSWAELPTNVLNIDEENAYYDAVSPGFSFFAISLNI